MLRPRSSGAIWADPADVALVVEVETATSRRYDRILKPAIYADAGIPAYWRVSPEPGAKLHRYELGTGGYLPVQTIQGADPVKVDAPFPSVSPRAAGPSPSSWVRSR